MKALLIIGMWVVAVITNFIFKKIQPKEFEPYISFICAVYGIYSAIICSLFSWFVIMA